ncbi:MAG TPA: ComEA family DNA-binding protein [Ktedonobacterales bacterium]|nr:ComEA family DNA-binding protein [Ktedonobacterales bacterium]
MARRRVVYISGPIGRILAWRYINACLLLLICALSIGIVIQALNRAGNWPPAFMRAHPTVAITGPGVTQQIEGYVLGAVLRPGVYTLHSGARVRELVEAAGGLLDNADITRVDLAALLADGQAIYVPRLGEQVPLQLGGKLNLNVATETDLHNALGITTSIARKIIAYRAAHGSFTSVSQLLLVPVSKATYDRIKDLVTV